MTGILLSALPQGAMTSMHCYKLWLFHTDTGDQTWVLIPAQLEKYEKKKSKEGKQDVHKSPGTPLLSPYHQSGPLTPFANLECQSYLCFQIE